jgi:hypothetical protein
MSIKVRHLFQVFRTPPFQFRLLIFSEYLICTSTGGTGAKDYKLPPCITLWATPGAFNFAHGKTGSTLPLTMTWLIA